MPTLLKFIKFCIVGGLGMGIDFFITWLLKEKGALNKYIANTAGFISAATSNYFFNRLWTFQSQNNNLAIEYLSFVLIAVAGLLFNNLIVYLLTEKKQMNFYVAKIFAIGIVTIWNFIANYFITFRL